MMGKHGGRRIGWLLILIVIAAAAGCTRPPEHAEPPPAPVVLTSSTPSAAPTSRAIGPARLADLAAEPMPQLPPAAAWPHPMTLRTAGPPIRVSSPNTATPEGAVAALRAVDTDQPGGAGQAARYAQRYRARSEPGAPDPVTTRWFGALSSQEATHPMLVSAEIGWGMVKGTAGGGAVVCVLGVLTVLPADAAGPATKRGLADCQAMRWTETGWQIAAGMAAAAPADVWPGSDDAVRVGWRELA